MTAPPTRPSSVSYTHRDVYKRQVIQQDINKIALDLREAHKDDFHAYMVEKYPDLERGESASKTGRKHIPTRLFKQAVSLSKQARAIEAALDGINPLNAGKKKEEALSLLKKWFPQMENFSGQLKKYKVCLLYTSRCV